MKKILLITTAIFAASTISAQTVGDGSRDLSKYANDSFSEDDKYHVETPYQTVSVSQVKDRKIKNIIVMIGDGMGLEHLSVAWVLNGGRLNLDNFPYAGYSRTYATDKLITDSCAGGNAISTGVKTKYGYMGLDPEGNIIESSLVKAQKLGKKTGIITTCRINDATPLDFAGHSSNRGEDEINCAQYVDAGIDFISGGGYKFFAKRTIDSRNLIDEMVAKGYEYCPDTEALLASKSEKILSLPYDVDFPPALDRGDYLERTTMKAIETLSGNKNGFYLMVEGSDIDHYAHANKVGHMAEEIFDFDRTIGRVLEWAEKDGHTLVVVTADHNTGGITLTRGDLQNREVRVHFSTRGHSGIVVPVFAYGPHAADFAGIHDNNEIGSLIAKYVK